MNATTADRLAGPSTVGRANGRALNGPLIVAVLLAAWVARLYLLDSQSLWYDEGTTAALVSRSLDTIAYDAAHDIHPPLYYFVLHSWVAVAGLSEFALRLPSASFGVLALALTAKLGQRIFDVRVGLVAAVLSVFAPILIYYSQEARMYSQAMMLGALSTYLLLSIMTSPRHRTGLFLGYVLATAAMLYTHYFAFTIALAQGVYCLVHHLTSQRRGSHATSHLKIVFIAQVLAGLLFAPWLAISLGQLVSWPSISAVLSLDELVRGVLRAFTFGIGWEASYTIRRELAVAIVVLAGFLAILRRREASLLPLCLVLVPVMAMYVLSLRRPMFNPKFLLPLAPAFYLCAAAGIVVLSQIARYIADKLRPAIATRVWTVALGLGIASFLYPAAASLQGYYFDTKYARDDYRGLAAFVAGESRAGDAVILYAPGQIEIFEYYYRGDLPRFPLPKQRPIDEAATLRDLASISSQHPRLWMVAWAADEADPNGVVEQWLAGNATIGVDASFGFVRLTRYDLKRSGP